MIRSIWKNSLEIPATVYSLWQSAIEAVTPPYDRLVRAGRYFSDPPEAVAIEDEAEAAHRRGDLAAVAAAVARWREVWLARLERVI